MLDRIIPGLLPETALALETAAKRFPTVGVRLSAPRVENSEKVIDISITNDEFGNVSNILTSAEFGRMMGEKLTLWRSAAAERWKGVYKLPRPAKPAKEKGGRLPKVPPAVKPEPAPSSLPAMREAVDSLRNLPIGQLSDRELANKISRLRREIKQNPKLIPLLVKAEQEQARRKAGLREPSRYQKAGERRDRVGSFAVPSTTENLRTYKCK